MERARGEADGTGVAIKGIKKRGKELKVFIQEKVTGGVHIAGLSIGKYEGEWNKLFKPLINSLKAFDNFLLVTDGETSILKGLEEDKEIEAIIKIKDERLDKLISSCKCKGYSSCSSYLENARAHMFTGLSSRLKGLTTSKVERVMKTVNMRIKMGKWSPTGALNAIKVRLAHYYNGFDPAEEMEAIEVHVLKA